MKKDIEKIPAGVIEAVTEAKRHARCAESPMRVLFVCLGNICRSPAAHGIAESMAASRGMSDELICDSAGFYGGHVGDLPDPRMRAAAFQRGYRLGHRARQIREADFDNFDLIVGMDDYNLRDLHNLAPTPEDEQRIVSMADFAVEHPDADCVPDPYYEGAAGFQLVLNLLEDACASLLEAIRNP